MKNSIVYIFFIAIFFCSCNKNDSIVIQIVNNEEVSIGSSVKVLLINASNENYNLAINNTDTITISDSNNFYYKIYDENFKELNVEEINILDGEFLISNDYEIIKQKMQDSLGYFRLFNLAKNDTLHLNFFIKSKFYDTPLSYQEYQIKNKNTYYISFFYKKTCKNDVKKDNEYCSQRIQSDYYKLKLSD